MFLDELFQHLLGLLPQGGLFGRRGVQRVLGVGFPQLDGQFGPLANVQLRLLEPLGAIQLGQGKEPPLPQPLQESVIFILGGGRKTPAHRQQQR